MTALTITPDQISAVTPLIGARINPTYNDPEVITPTQQGKITAIAISAIAAVAGIFCVLASFGTSSIVFPLLTSILLAEAALGAYYIATVKDYDNPQERQTYVDAIAREFLVDIAKNHTPQEVIGYRLLGEIAEPRVYVAFLQLAEDFQTARTNFNAQIDQIQFDDRYDRQMCGLSPAHTRANITATHTFYERCRHINTQFETFRPRLII